MSARSVSPDDVLQELASLQDATHAATVERYLGGTPCDLVAERGGYPYPCKRQDREPDALVVTCKSHGTWWVAA